MEEALSCGAVKLGQAACFCDSGDEYFSCQRDILEHFKCPMLFLWVLAPCRLVGRCGDKYCPHLQG